MCHGVHVEVKGQFAAVASFPLPYEVLDQTQVVQACWQAPLPAKLSYEPTPLNITISRVFNYTL